MKYILIALTILIPVFLHSEDINSIKDNSDRVKTDHSSNNDSDKNNKAFNEVHSGWYLDAKLGAKVNYDGAGFITNIYYRFPLIKKCGNTKMNLGFQEFLTPAFQRISVYTKIEPIAFFDITAYAGYDYLYKGGTGDGMQAMISPKSNYDPKSREHIKGRKKGGLRMSVIPCVKFIYGHIAAMYSLKVEYHYYNHNGYYYDYDTHIIHKGKDIGFKCDATIAYIAGPYNKIGTFTIGINFYDYWINCSGKNYMLIAGILLYNASWSDTIAPYFQLSAGSHLQDRYKKGKPYAALGIGIKWKFY